MFRNLTPKCNPYIGDGSADTGTLRYEICTSDTIRRWACQHSILRSESCWHNEREWYGIRTDIVNYTHCISYWVYAVLRNGMLGRIWRVTCKDDKQIWSSPTDAGKSKKTRRLVAYKFRSRNLPYESQTLCGSTKEFLLRSLFYDHFWRT